MGKPIPTADAVAKKWSTRAASAQPDYVAQVKQSTWKAEAAAGEANYAKGVTQAVANKSRLNGINKTTDQAWQDAVANKADRYTTGVNAGVDKMTNGMNTVLNDIKSGMATLPAKGPKGDPGNYQRSQKLGDYLHQAKVKRKSGA